jgi:hypothetical protein
VEHWHDAIGDPTLADAMLDRLLHNAYKITRRCSKGVDLLPLTRGGEIEKPNTSEWHHGDPGPALLPLSRHRYCATWHDTAREATLSVPRVPGSWAYVSPGICLRWSIACREAADR